MSSDMELLVRFIEHAPRDPGPLAGNIRGWWLPPGEYVCAHCAGRIMARGCQLPRGSEPAWSDGKPAQFGQCGLSGKGASHE